MAIKDVSTYCVKCRGVNAESTSDLEGTTVDALVTTFIGEDQNLHAIVRCPFKEIYGSAYSADKPFCGKPHLESTILPGNKKPYCIYHTPADRPNK